jgi:hypothetical protein
MNYNEVKMKKLLVKGANKKRITKKNNKTDNTMTSDKYKIFNEEDILKILPEIISEIWRFKKSIEQMNIECNDSTKNKKLYNSLQRVNKKISDYLDFLNIEIKDYTGEFFEIGLPIKKIINNDEFNENEKFIIEMMIEPVIKVKNSEKILKQGVVSIRREN